MYKLQAFPVAFNIQHMESVYTKSLYYTRRSIRYMYIHTNLPTCFEIKHRNNSTLLTYTILKKHKKEENSNPPPLFLFIFSSLPQNAQSDNHYSGQRPTSLAKLSRPSKTHTHLPHGILH